jgi:hypothetical protein
MVSKECNLRAGVYKVQTFGTLHRHLLRHSFSRWSLDAGILPLRRLFIIRVSRPDLMAIS